MQNATLAKVLNFHVALKKSDRCQRYVASWDMLLAREFEAFLPVVIKLAGDSMLAFLLLPGCMLTHSKTPMNILLQCWTESLGWEWGWAGKGSGVVKGRGQGHGRMGGQK